MTRRRREAAAGAGTPRRWSRAGAWRRASVPVLVLVLVLAACSGVGLSKSKGGISDYGLYLIDVGDGAVTALVEGTHSNSVDLSPDGSRMVYSGVTPYFLDSEPGASEYSGFFVAGVDGSDPVLLTDELVWRRMWSPDSSRVLYTTERDGLFAFSMDDYSSTKLSDNRPAVVVFSEGGSVLHSDDEGLFVSAVDGSGDRRLATFADEHERRGWKINHGLGGWVPSPEAATHVAFHTGNRLMLAAIDDPGDSRLLTDLPPRDPYVCTPSGSIRRCRRLTDLPHRDSYYSWSPDGTKLGYIADENLHVAAVDGPEPMLLAEGGVHSFEWSPDSAKVAYTVEDDPVEDDPSGRSLYLVAYTVEDDPSGRSLYVVDADGGEPLLLSGQGYAYWPRWSPDSSHVAYYVSVRPDDTRAQLTVSKLDGSDPRPVASVTAERDLSYNFFGFDAPFFRWLDEGRRLLYVADFNEAATRGELAVHDIHTDTTTTLTGAWSGYLELAPDRSRFTYWTRNGLHLADTGRGHQMQLGAASDQSHGWLDSWSPDGTRLVFNDTDGGYVVDAGTGAKRQISDEEIGYRFWSPDGHRLAYATRRGVHLHDTNTGETRKLATVSQGFSVIVPHWIPDGSAVTVEVHFVDYE